LIAVIQELLELGRDLHEAGVVAAMNVDALFALIQRSLECRAWQAELGRFPARLCFEHTVVTPWIAGAWDTGLGLSSGHNRGGLFQDGRCPCEDFVDHKDFVGQTKLGRIHVEEVVNGLDGQARVGGRRSVAVNIGIPCWEIGGQNICRNAFVG